ncbi:MAG: radical SAM protein [Candidatus Omnitrophica bacterium]|nr:radical SAM protein [Candidatus Omnitrophota bacterium]
MASLGYIQVIRTCNQECRFCSNPPTGKIIPLKDAKKHIDSYIKKGYEAVLLTGGEPTLYPDLSDIIHYAQKRGIHCLIITNGQKIADMRYLGLLVDNGLDHIIVSIYSYQNKIQSFLTKNKISLYNIKKALRNAEKLKITVDIATVINKYNADHLDKIVKWLVQRFPFIKHFIWNNVDPLMNRTSKNPDTIPRLNDFELALHKAMSFLESHGRSFRVERVPLCYMSDSQHCSTEARKIVKQEERSIYFLDKKGYVTQKGYRGFLGYSKADCCKACSLNEICAGLYAADKYYSLAELYPVFVSKENIVNKINGYGKD